MKVCKIDDCGKKCFGHGLCNMHYSRLRRYGDVNFVKQIKSGTLSDRLKFHGWSINSLGCWEVKTALNEHGYGVISFNGQHLLAHRAAYLAWVGPLRPEQIVRHRCDNPSCINPDDLLAGTPADNVADCIARGRRYSQRLKGYRSG